MSYFPQQVPFAVGCNRGQRQKKRGRFQLQFGKLSFVIAPLLCTVTTITITITTTAATTHDKTFFPVTRTPIDRGYVKFPRRRSTPAPIFPFSNYYSTDAWMGNDDLGNMRWQLTKLLAPRSFNLNASILAVVS